METCQQYWMAMQVGLRLKQPGFKLLDQGLMMSHLSFYAAAHRLQLYQLAPLLLLQQLL